MTGGVFYRGGGKGILHSDAKLKSSHLLCRADELPKSSRLLHQP